MTPVILALNTGSSSIKFSLYRFPAAGQDPGRLVSGQFTGIGDDPRLTIRDAGGDTLVEKGFPADRRHEQLLEELGDDEGGAE